MTPNESQFFDKAPLAHPTSIYTADGNPMLVSHKGTIYTPSLSLSDTFHIPKLSLNLLSVGQLCVLGVDHMTRNELQFSDKAPLAHPTSIYTADGTLMLVSHKGIIYTPSLSLSDTFHIPKLSFNLLSVGQLCVLGVDILFTNHGVDVQDPWTGQVLEIGCKVGHMFEVHNLKILSC